MAGGSVNHRTPGKLQLCVLYYTLPHAKTWLIVLSVNFKEWSYLIRISATPYFDHCFFISSCSKHFTLYLHILLKMSYIFSQFSINLTWTSPKSIFHHIVCFDFTNTVLKHHVENIINNPVCQNICQITPCTWTLIQCVNFCLCCNRENKRFELVKVSKKMVYKYACFIQFVITFSLSC